MTTHFDDNGTMESNDRLSQAVEAVEANDALVLNDGWSERTGADYIVDEDGALWLKCWVRFPDGTG